MIVVEMATPLFQVVLYDWYKKGSFIYRSCFICVVCFIAHSGVLKDLTIWVTWSVSCQKSLKIPKGWSETVNWRTDNTIVKKTKDKRTNNNLQTRYTQIT